MNICSGDVLSTVRPTLGLRTAEDKTSQHSIQKLHHNNFHIEVILGDCLIGLRLSEVTEYRCKVLVRLNGDQLSTQFSQQV